MASLTGSTSVPTPNTPHLHRYHGRNTSRNTPTRVQYNSHLQHSNSNASSPGSYFPRIGNRPNFYDHQQTLPMISQPRSFEDLHTERTYLLNSLQAQNAYATDLLRRIPAVEERLSRLGNDGKSRRQTKKQINWLKRCLDETCGQEQAILGRLGQLSFEIQSRERWNQIENERRHVEFQQLNLNCQVGVYQDLQQMQFNPSRPEFYPQGYANPQITGSHISTIPMQWPESPRQAANDGFVWQEHGQEQMPTQAAKEQREDIASTEVLGSDCIAIGEKKNIEQVLEEKTVPSNSVTPPLTSRSASMDFAELSLNTFPARWLPFAKRLSLPTLPEYSKVWTSDIWEDKMRKTS